MNNFDWTYYIDKYPDLQKMRIDTKDKAIYHYKKFGIKENRFPNKYAEINNTKLNNNNNKIIQLEKKIESLTKEIQLIKKIINNNNYYKTDSDDNYNEIIYYN